MEMQKQLPGIKFILPTAPILPVTVNGGAFSASLTQSHPWRVRLRLNILLPLIILSHSYLFLMFTLGMKMTAWHDIVALETIDDKGKEPFTGLEESRGKSICFCLLNCLSSFFPVSPSFSVLFSPLQFMLRSSFCLRTFHSNLSVSVFSACLQLTLLSTKRLPQE